MTTARGGRASAGPSSVSVRVYTYALALTLVTFGMGWWGIQWQGDVPWDAVAVLSVLGVLGANLREREIGDDLGVSFTTVVLAAAMALAGPGGAVLVGYVSYLADARHQRWRSRVFNPAMTGCISGAGAYVYVATGGLFPVGEGGAPLELLGRVALPMLAGYLTSVVLNTTLIGVMVALTRGTNAVSATLDTLRTLGPGYVVHVLLAILFVLLWEPVGLGGVSVLLVVAPLLLTQWALSRDAAERRSQRRTVRTLMGALEVATPYSIGHSSRVAELTDRMAPRLGVVGASADALHFAALLHDLGLVSTAPHLPHDAAPDDVTYLAVIHEHPEAGVQMLSDIDFLAPAIPGILHHHERFDGLGYPAGLAGADIPVLARIIAVADAFDSLTTNRSYRAEVSDQEALHQLRQRSGTHLDPEVVQALDEVLSETPWEPTRIGEAMLRAAAEVNDHDDPAVSDGYAAWQPESDEARA